MNLEFATSSRILFGMGEFKRLGELAAPLGHRALVLVGRSALEEEGILGRARTVLEAKKVESDFLAVEPEPTVKVLEGLLAEARESDPEMLIAIGGGSVIDAGKILAVLLPNTMSVREFADASGATGETGARPLPMIAVPTTAGAGAEATRNAYYRDFERKDMGRVRNAQLSPTVALVDPILTAGCPQKVNSACALATLARLIESFVSRQAGILTDGSVREGLGLAVGALSKMSGDSEDPGARESMALASLMSGMAADNVGLGAVHALAAAVGGYAAVPYGVACANLLAEITRVNVEQVAGTDPKRKIYARFEETARIVTGKADADFEALVQELRRLPISLGIPSLSSYGLRGKDIRDILDRCRNDAMRTNPVYLDDRTLAQALDIVIASDATASAA